MTSNGHGPEGVRVAQLRLKHLSADIGADHSKLDYHTDCISGDQYHMHLRELTEGNIVIHGIVHCK